MTATSDKPQDLVILGGGLVGMTLALAAAKKGLSSHVIDRADPAELTAEGFDDLTATVFDPLWPYGRGCARPTVACPSS